VGKLLEPDSLRLQRFAVLESMRVDPSLRNRGIGSMLIRYFLEWGPTTRRATGQRHRLRRQPACSTSLSSARLHPFGGDHANGGLTYAQPQCALGETVSVRRLALLPPGVLRQDHERRA